MKDISTIQFHTGSKEELLPGYTPEFPYIASHVVLGGLRRFVPWHWHRAVELFYIREGSLLYQTPNYRKVFEKEAAVWYIPMSCIRRHFRKEREPAIMWYIFLILL